MWTRRDLHPLHRVTTTICYCIHHGPGSTTNSLNKKEPLVKVLFCLSPLNSRVFMQYTDIVVNIMLANTDILSRSSLGSGQTVVIFTDHSLLLPTIGNVFNTFHALSSRFSLTNMVRLSKLRSNFGAGVPLKYFQISLYCGYLRNRATDM